MRRPTSGGRQTAVDKAASDKAAADKAEPVNSGVGRQTFEFMGAAFEDTGGDHERAAYVGNEALQYDDQSCDTSVVRGAFGRLSDSYGVDWALDVWWKAAQCPRIQTLSEGSLELIQNF